MGKQVAKESNAAKLVLLCWDRDSRSFSRNHLDFASSSKGRPTKKISSSISAQRLPSRNGINWHFGRYWSGKKNDLIQRFSNRMRLNLYDGHLEGSWHDPLVSANPFTLIEISREHYDLILTDQSEDGVIGLAESKEQSNIDVFVAVFSVVRPDLFTSAAEIRIPKAKYLCPNTPIFWLEIKLIWKATRKFWNFYLQEENSQSLGKLARNLLKGQMYRCTWSVALMERE